MSVNHGLKGDALGWNLARGLGKGLALLRQAAPAAAREAVTHVCTHETRWDPDREDRGHYLAKALAIAGDPAIEDAVLDRWERGIPLRYRGPWSDVGLVLAGLGRPRAVKLATRESAQEAEEPGPGAPAFPEGLTDVREWLDAIRDDARLRVGGGLRVGHLARIEDLNDLVRALRDEGCPHLQESVAVAFTRVRDDRARDWFVERIEEDADAERTYWWWQGLSGQRPAPRARALALSAVDTTRPPYLQWVQLTLLRNYQAGDEAVHLRGVERGLREAAEDAVSVTLDWMRGRWHRAYGHALLAVVRESAYGRNRVEALDLAAQQGVAIPDDDLLLVLEDAELECRTRAVRRLPRQKVADRLIAIGATEGEDPGFLTAIREVFGS